MERLRRRRVEERMADFWCGGDRAEEEVGEGVGGDACGCGEGEGCGADFVEEGEEDV